jgi:hypothetical protein
MCENMAICVKIWLSLDIGVKIWLFLKCVQFLKVLCSIFYEHYTESDNYSVTNEEEGRHVQATRVSYPWRRDMRPRNACLISEEKGDAPTQHASPF